MYLLDTNVISELRKVAAGSGDAAVVAWARSVDVTTQHLSVITILEVETGIRRLARRDPAQAAVLRAWIDGEVLPTFRGRLLPIDVDVARQCAPLHVPNRRPANDAFIAATARVHGLTVVTRNVADFAGTGVRLLDPWRDPAAA